MTSDTRITLAHGNGGRFMRELIERTFVRRLGNLLLDTQADAVSLPLDQEGAEVMITTDGFTVKPLEFPGGNIGSLAIHGTVNDLSVAGATPLYLTLNAFIEEGLEIAVLERLVDGMAHAAREAQVTIVAGDTKVVPRGEGSGVYFATTGVGLRDRNLYLGMERIQHGDRIVVSGPVGDHGICVLLAREQFGLSGDLKSDAASVTPLTDAARELEGVRFMRDPTRGGLAAVSHEIARATHRPVRLSESAIPVRDAVRAVCDMLGYDPYYLACEGRVVAVVAPQAADELLARWRALPLGKEAAIIGEMGEGRAEVILTTELGGERLLEELEDDPLPRIC
ncbi:hydrogenase expression/formation protein HypE [Endothiovibrio diazotrophicus]